MPEQERIFSIEGINKYLKRYDTVEGKEAVQIELQSGKILGSYLDSPEGRLVIDSVIDGIRLNMRKIISLSVDGFDKNLTEIRHSSLQISEAHDFLCGLRTILDRADEHAKGIKSVEGYL